MIDNYDLETEDGELVPMGRGRVSSESKVLTYRDSVGLMLCSFQYMENYGGENPYWKFKGGAWIVVSKEVFESSSLKEKFVWENEMTKQYLNHAEMLVEDLTFEIPEWVWVEDEEDYINLMAPKIFDGFTIKNIDFQ